LPAPDLAALFASLDEGNPAPVAAAFHAADAPCTEIMRHLLSSPLDAPVAEAFRLIWRNTGPAVPAGRAGLLRWYIADEVASALPARNAALQAILARLMTEEALEKGQVGASLCFAAVRAAVERGGTGLKARAGRFLRRIAAEWLDAPGRPITTAFLYAAIQSVDLTLMRQLIDRLEGQPGDAEIGHAANWALGLIHEFAGIDPWLAGVIERQFTADPESPAAAQRMAQLGLHRGQPFATIAPLFHAIRPDPQDHTLQPALQFALWQAENEGLDDEAARLRTRLPALSSENAAGPPDPVVVAARRLVEDDQATPEALALGFGDLAASIATMEFPPGATVDALLATAYTLRGIDRSEVSWLTHFTDTPHAQGAPHYGTVDLRRFPVLHDGLMRCIAALCRAGIDRALTEIWPCALAPLARMAALHNAACLAIDSTGEALELLDRLGAARLLPDILALLRDDCHLQTGTLSAPPPSRKGTRALPFLDRTDWTHAEAIQWTTLAGDAPIHGQFDLVWPDGRLQICDHIAPAGEVATARIPGLSLMAEDFLIGPAGHALRPDPYHTSAEFPWTSAVMVAAQKRALRLRPEVETRCATPVLLLEAFEALRWRNYYHWVIPLLSRVALALEKGLLEGRLLVVPEGLTGWMKASLALIGLTPERLKVVPQGHRIRFDDALLMSSVEHLSASTLHALRRNLLGSQALTATAGAPLFLSRAAQKLRKLHNEAAIEEMAREMGFHVIAPQTLPLAEQISLFAAAPGIAAAEGAALTNTLFCSPGTRVLAMLCETDMMPIYNDLSLVLGHQHRKLAGHGMADCKGGNRFQPPFSIDLPFARQSLDWVLKG
jgi:hypothetical protein